MIYPNQEDYLAIVKRFFEQRGIGLPWKEIEARAVQLERQQNGRSGPTRKAIC